MSIGRKEERRARDVLSWLNKWINFHWAWRERERERERENERERKRERERERENTELMHGPMLRWIKVRQGRSNLCPRMKEWKWSKVITALKSETFVRRLLVSGSTVYITVKWRRRKEAQRERKREQPLSHLIGVDYMQWHLLYFFPAAVHWVENQVKSINPTEWYIERKSVFHCYSANSQLNSVARTHIFHWFNPVKVLLQWRTSEPVVTLFFTNINHIHCLLFMFNCCVGEKKE